MASETESTSPRPIVAVPTSVMDITGRAQIAHAIGRNYLHSTMDHAGVLTYLLPSMPDRLDIKEVISQIDGLMLTGGRANVEPHHYDGPPFPDDEPIDPDRDNTVLPLIRACLDEGVPIFGTCRGLQEINVALGGSLHYRIHVLPGKNDHRMPRDPNVPVEEVMALRHPVRLTPGELFNRLTGKEEVMVNSLHGQGVDRLADGLTVEAVSPDDIVEGISVTGAKSFASAVQWHSEWKAEEHELSRKLYEAFGAATRERQAKRLNGVGGID